jgi:DNA-binding LytR/AlgR family response regulator
MKINCVILDDEPENLKYLQQIIEDIDDVVIVKSFTDAATFTAAIKELVFDMCILDNRLPISSGVELAKKLTNKKIIFVSAHDISAHEAFEVNAVDVLKKPVSKDRLERAIKKCRDKIINEKGYVFLKTSEGKTRLKLDEIVYIRSEEISAYKYIVMKDGDEIKTLKITFPEILKKLPDDLFCQINKSIILNTAYFKTFGKDDLVYINLKDNKNKLVSFYCGDTYLDFFKKLIGADMV